MRNFFCAKDYRIQHFLSLILIVSLVFVMTGCEKEPIKVGFIGELSGARSQLAVDARNGVQLYVNALNENGGIDGRMIELIIKDNGGSDEQALAVHRAFIDEGVHFVIGDLLSNKAQTLLDSNSEELLFVSPSISSEKLSDKDDFILRTAPLSKQQGELFAEYVLRNDLENVVIVYDLMNQAYSENVMKAAKVAIENGGLDLLDVIPYHSKEDELPAVADQIEVLNPDHVFFLSSAVDTAFLIQRVKNYDQNIQAFSVSWSMTKDLIENGGDAVEGTIFVALFEPDEPTQKMKNFEEEYMDVYGTGPSFVSKLANDAAMVLFRGMEEVEEITPQSVKEKIIKIGVFSGLYEDFSINQYGDNDKTYMFLQLIDGEFIPMGE